MGICLKTMIVIIIISNIAKNSVFGVRFDIESGHTKCIAENIQSNSMSVGKYKIVNPNQNQNHNHNQFHEEEEENNIPLPPSHNITIRVTSSYGNTNHYADHVASGQFSFLAAEAGDYMACFWAVDHKPPTTITVDFEWKTGIAAKDWSNVAKKGSIDAMELELKKLQDMVTSIHDEMFYLRGREEEMQELNRTTNARMGWLTVLSFVICLSVAGLQLWHLKTFFEKKKLI